MYPYVIKKMGSSRSVDRDLQSSKEDLLTSLVFGAMKYLPDEVFLTSFLNEVATPVPDELIDPEITLWPQLEAKNLSEERDRTRVEPDVIIEYENHILIGESKFDSALKQKQLEDQWTFAKGTYPDEKQLHVVAITPRRREKQIMDRESWSWISWQQLSAMLREVNEEQLTIPQQNMIQDLIGALQEFGISPIYVFDCPGEVPHPKSYPNIKGSSQLRKEMITFQKILQTFDDLEPVPMSTISLDVRTS